MTRISVDPFPTSPGITPANGFRPAWRRIIVALAVVALVGLRKHDSFAHPQFWAEDGGLFFIQAESHPWTAILLPYEGYLHLLPRLIAVVGRGLPLAIVPTFYVLSALCVSGIVAWAIQSPRIRFPGAWAAALAIALIPHTGEVYLTICNLQWILAIGLLGLVLADDASTRLQRVSDAGSLIVMGLTGPFIVIALPLFAWRAWRRRSRWSLAMLLLAAACSAANAPSLFAYHPTPRTASFSLVHAVAMIGWRAIATLGTGVFYPGEIACIILACALPALAIGVLWRRGFLADGLVLLSASVLILAATAYKAGYDQWPLSNLVNADRYFFVSKVLSVWFMVAIASTAGKAVRGVILFLLLAAFVVNMPRFVFPPFPDQNWRKYSGLIEHGVLTRVPILPDGFSFVHPGRRN